MKGRNDSASLLFGNGPFVLVDSPQTHAFGERWDLFLVIGVEAGLAALGLRFPGTGRVCA